MFRLQDEDFWGDGPLLPRHLTPSLRQSATEDPVITLTGPRQSGKTTLVRATFPDHAYVSLETPDQREFAIEDASRGDVFESWVVSEALKAYYHGGETPRLYFWRDSAGHEIDLLIDRGQTLTPVEIKSGQTINDDFFKGLMYWRSLPEQAGCPAALVHGGDQTYMRRQVEMISWRQWG